MNALIGDAVIDDCSLTGTRKNLFVTVAFPLKLTTYSEISMMSISDEVLNVNDAQLNVDGGWTSF